VLAGAKETEVNARKDTTATSDQAPSGDPVPLRPMAVLRRGLSTGWRARLALCIAFAVIAAPLIGWKAVHNRQLSVFDEWQYVDRVHQVSTGDFVIRDGQRISAWAHQQLTCRGIVRIVEPQPKRCDNPHKRAPNANSAASDPPTYFWTTGVATRAVLVTGLTDNVVTAARLVGIGWAVLAMLSVYLLARTLGAGRIGSFLAGSTQVLVPVFAQQYTYVTPHALDVPVGALVVIATIRWMRGQWRWWALVLAGALTGLSKGTNITVVVAMGVFLLAVLAWPGTFERAMRVRALRGGLLLGGSAVATTVLWTVVVDLMRKTTYPPPGDYVVDSLDPAALSVDAIRFVTPFGDAGMIFFGTFLMSAMTGAALVRWAGLSDGGPLLRPLAAGYVVGAILAPLVLAFLVFVTTDQYIGTQLRYGLALWPLGLAFAALLLRTRTAVVIAGVFLIAYWAMPFVWNLDGITV
jgi:hypothetical protein